MIALSMTMPTAKQIARFLLAFDRLAHFDATQQAMRNLTALDRKEWPVLPDPDVAAVYAWLAPLSTAGESAPASDADAIPAAWILKYVDAMRSLADRAPANSAGAETLRAGMAFLTTMVWAWRREAQKMKGQ